jgi:hypothetical protein
MYRWLFILLLTVIVSGCTSKQADKEINTGNVPEKATPSATVSVTPTPEPSASENSPALMDITKLQGTSFGFADKTGKYIISISPDEAVEVDQTLIQQLNHAIGENSVDDGGEISPDMFAFLFAAHTDNGIAIGVKWMGAEGENITILQQTGEHFVETEMTSSRYLSPM